jgi:hypothetical protein
MQDQADTVPHGYIYPFATVSDNYTFDDYWEDCLHFSTLMRQGDVFSEIRHSVFSGALSSRRSRSTLFELVLGD